MQRIYRRKDFTEGQREKRGSVFFFHPHVLQLFILFYFILKIQKLVISGGNFKPDTLKPKEVVSLLLDDEEIEQKCKIFITYSLFCKKNLHILAVLYSCDILEINKR